MTDQLATYATRPPFGQLGQLDRDVDGRVVCHLCGRAFRSLATHARLTHGLPAAEYREEFGLARSTPLVCAGTSERWRAAAERSNHTGLLCPFTKGHQPAHVGNVTRRRLQSRRAMSASEQRKAAVRWEAFKPAYLAARAVALSKVKKGSPHFHREIRYALAASGVSRCWLSIVRYERRLGFLPPVVPAGETVCIRCGRARCRCGAASPGQRNPRPRGGRPHAVGAA